MTRDPHRSRTASRAPWRSTLALLTLALTVAGLLIGVSHAQQPAPALAAETTPPTVPPVIAPPDRQSVMIATGYNQRTRLLRRGLVVYQNYCIGCHGEVGDGNGPAAKRLIVKPRDFTSGIYKFRSTDSGSLPMETDIHRTIVRGLSRVSMPAFPLMPEQDKVAVIEYIKTFYTRWHEEAPQRKKVFVPLAPRDVTSQERAQRGRVVYLAMGCSSCHGMDGAGAGATQNEYDDAWGDKIKAFNFTQGRLKSGDDPEDIYRVFHTGLRSVMPSFGGTTLAYVSRQQALSQDRFMLEGEKQTLAPYLAQFPESMTDITAMSETQLLDQASRNSWDLVAYILSLRRTQTATPTGEGGQE